MKFVFAAFAALLSISASAQSFSSSPRACTFQDWSRISSALDGQSMPIRESDNSLAVARSLLVQEIAPECQKLPLAAGSSIPGNKYEQYVVSSGETQVEIVIVTSVEENSTYSIVTQITQ